MLQEYLTNIVSLSDIKPDDKELEAHCKENKTHIIWQSILYSKSLISAYIHHACETEQGLLKQLTKAMDIIWATPRKAKGQSKSIMSVLTQWFDFTSHHQDYLAHSIKLLKSFVLLIKSLPKTFKDYHIPKWLQPKNLTEKLDTLLNAANEKYQRLQRELKPKVARPCSQFFRSHHTMAGAQTTPAEDESIIQPVLEGGALRA